MKKFKKMVCTLLLGAMMCSSSITTQAASSSSSYVREYTEKEQTSTGIKYGKHYRISTIKIYYTYQDCVKLKKQAAAMTGLPYQFANYCIGLIPHGYGLVAGGVMGCISFGASGAYGIFAKAVSKNEGVEMSYEYWECTNGSTYLDNLTKNYHLRYR